MYIELSYLKTRSNGSANSLRINLKSIRGSQLEHINQTGHLRISNTTLNFD